MYLGKTTLLFMVLGLIVVSGCSAPQISVADSEPVELVEQILEFDYDTVIESMPYVRPEGLSAQETVEEYILQQYQIYTDLEYTDLSSLIDLSESRNESVVIWLQALVQRRRLLMETDLCYVETQKYPYEFQWLKEEELQDERMNFWSERLELQKETAVHFRITGEQNRAYPPMLAINAQHTVFLKQIDGEWMITFHYYPGARRRSGYDGPVFLAPENQMIDELWSEFQSEGDGFESENFAVPDGATEYTPILAVEYALRHTEAPNPDFYHVGDWMGNCSNFVSQCTWFAFGDGSYPDLNSMEHMTPEWFAGAGGGSSAWENVSRFWAYATGNNELQGIILDSADQLRAGDIIQLGAVGGEEETFNHCFLVVDSTTLLLAQNSPACFVYYSDLVLAETRYFRPVYLME